MDKQLNYDGRQVTLVDPESVSFDTKFHEKIYRHIFDAIDGDCYKPYLDVDSLSDESAALDVVELARSSGVEIDPPSTIASNRHRLHIQHHVRSFLQAFPQMVGLVNNTIMLADLSIKNAEFLLGKQCDSTNFIEVKRVIDDVNSKAWCRDKDTSERQSGVSTLGNISESLLKRAFDSMVDTTNFFKVNRSEVQSYGDFVLMCLPNNLWLSVKSNFARERLLASGYNNDIIGVGFFEDYREFIGQVRIRNFQRAGFLAMYCPDIAVTEDQVDGKTSTYKQIFDHHKVNRTDMPKNINGRPFIRRLSDLQGDLKSLLDEAEVQRRFTVTF